MGKGDRGVTNMNAEKARELAKAFEFCDCSPVGECKHETAMNLLTSLADENERLAGQLKYHDVSVYGTYIEKDGKRVPPEEFYKSPEVMALEKELAEARAEIERLKAERDAAATVLFEHHEPLIAFQEIVAKLAERKDSAKEGV